MNATARFEDLEVPSMKVEIDINEPMNHDIQSKRHTYLGGNGANYK